MAEQPESLILRMLHDIRSEMQVIRTEMQSMRSSINALRLNLETVRVGQEALRADFQALRDEIPVLIHLEVGNAMRPFMNRLEKLESA